MDHLLPARSEMLFRRGAGIRLPLRIEVVAPAVGAAGPYQLRQCFQQRAMAPFALPQRGFRSHPLSHVAPDRGHEHPLVRSPARERNVEVRGLTLLAAADHLEPAFGVTDVVAVADKGAREIAVPFEQNSDLLPQQRSRYIAENMFRGSVEPLNRPVE